MDDLCKREKYRLTKTALYLKFGNKFSAGCIQILDYTFKLSELKFTKKLNFVKLKYELRCLK